MSEQDTKQSVDEAIKLHHLALSQLLNGDDQLYKERASRRPEVTIAGAWGGEPERGWAKVGKRYDWATEKFKGKKNKVTFENVSLVISEEMFYTVDIEHNVADFDGSGKLKKMDLRVTTVFVMEDGFWKMIHRHGDPLMKEQTTESAFAK